MGSYPFSCRLFGSLVGWGAAPSLVDRQVAILGLQRAVTYVALLSHLTPWHADYKGSMDSRVWLAALRETPNF